MPEIKVIETFPSHQIIQAKNCPICGGTQWRVFKDSGVSCVKCKYECEKVPES
jgi:hypothetical protein